MVALGLPQGPAQFSHEYHTSDFLISWQGLAWVGLGALGSSLAFACPACEACL